MDNRTPFEILRLIGSSALMETFPQKLANATDAERATFVDAYGCTIHELWDHLNRKRHVYDVEQVPFHYIFTREHPTANLVDHTEGMVVAVGFTNSIEVVNAQRVWQLEVRSNDHCQGALIDPNDETATMRGAVRHDNQKLKVAFDNPDFGGWWKAEVNALVTRLIPRDSKENTMELKGKPESLKKSSIARRAELTSETQTPSWESKAPALLIGDAKIAVDCLGCSEDEVAKLDKEWFWMNARQASVPSTSLPLPLALDKQAQLIDLSTQFSGVVVYLARTPTKTYVLPIDRKDDMALLTLLSATFWTESDRVHPSLMEHWRLDPDCEGFVVLSGLREALLVQENQLVATLQANAEEKSADTKSSGVARKTTAKRRRGGKSSTAK